MEKSNTERSIVEGHTFEIRERWLDAGGCLKSSFIGAASSVLGAEQIILECALPTEKLWVNIYDDRGQVVGGRSAAGFLAAEPVAF